MHRCVEIPSRTAQDLQLYSLLIYYSNRKGPDVISIAYVLLFDIRKSKRENNSSHFCCKKTANIKFKKLRSLYKRQIIDVISIRVLTLTIEL